MGTANRPNKPIGGGGNPTWAPGARLTANELDADITPLYSEVNGNLDSTNLKPAAAIQGTQLADAPSGIPTAKINDLQVTPAKLSGNIPASKLKLVVFNIPNLGAYGANEFKSFECTGVLSTTHRFLSRIFKIPTLLVSSDMSNVFPFYENEMQIDTSTNKYWLMTKCVSVPLNLTGWSVDIIFIEI